MVKRSLRATSTKDGNAKPVPSETIERAILFIRGQKVILDADLAKLYGVETKALNRSVNRNRERFPADFMFALTSQELRALRCQIGTSNIGRGGRRTLPYAFTEQGVAMLSSVLRSRRAVLVNVAIMQAFVRLRQVLATNKELAHKLAELERKLGEHDVSIRSLFDAIRQLMTPSVFTRPPRGCQDSLFSRYRRAAGSDFAGDESK
jgi:hypothetical protein